MWAEVVYSLRRIVPILAGVLLLGTSPASLRAQSPLAIYTDNLVNGFQDWSWGTRVLNNASPVHSGTYSVSHSGGAWNAVSFAHGDFNATNYNALSFWADGGSAGGQIIQVQAEYGTNSGPAYQLPSAFPTNSWRQFTVPFSVLGIANATNLHRLNLQLTASGSTAAFYIDDVQLNAKPPPALIHVQANIGAPLRTSDARWFGINTAVWDSYFDSAQTISLLREMGIMALRFPGGSLSDEYHWTSNTSLTNTWSWATSFASFVHVATNVGAQAFITVNYGTGTPQEAANWVRSANVTNHYGFKYWEIGNENYGAWETDSNSLPHDPYTYAMRATNYITQMKAADPSIRVGIVVTTGENSYSNSASMGHPAINPRTGQTNYGWTPVLLATLKGLGVKPDFVVHHVYPEYTGSESDALLLQSAASWGADAADLRQQITDYFGVGGSTIELVCTENNSNSGNQGKQSTSLVNGVYYADSLCQLMKTEFNSYVWWDLRNGTDYTGSMDPSLYGWRMYGDIALVGGSSVRYPPFYAAKLMQWFVRPGDTVLSATSDYSLISAYAARRTNGAVELLVLNKDASNTFNAQITMPGFIPNSAATIRSFGIPQDEAARTNGTAQAQDIAVSNFTGASTNFTFNFAPLSLTLFSFAPSAPALTALPAAAQPSGKFVFQLQGQSGERYVLQSSTNLNTWNRVSTNRLIAQTLMLTNPWASNSGWLFWRALWEP